MIHLPLDDHNGPVIVDIAEDGTVELILRGDDDTEPGRWKRLHPTEARALAAMLCHFAAEAER